MFFDPDNPIAQLCARGMELGGHEGGALFQQAWETAETDLEKCIAAHYVARNQDSVSEKLEWDETALFHGLKAGERIAGFYPSLYLNIAKCHEDLGAHEPALAHYLLAQKYAESLPDDGYSNLIRNGIKNGIGRVKDEPL
jgi:hypothetical protein